MARYIDADELLNKLPDDLPYKASVKRVLIQATTADVVPKSEVEKILAEMEKLVIKIRYDVDYSIFNMQKDFAKLKKKYTEDVK